jgi:hypothetical protein
MQADTVNKIEFNVITPPLFSLFATGASIMNADLIFKICNTAALAS